MLRSLGNGVMISLQWPSVRPLPPFEKLTPMAGGSGGPLQNLLGRSLLCSLRLLAPPTSASQLALPLPAEVVLPSAVECKPGLILPATLSPNCCVQFLLAS